MKLKQYGRLFCTIVCMREKLILCCDHGLFNGSIESLISFLLYLWMIILVWEFEVLILNKEIYS